MDQSEIVCKIPTPEELNVLKNRLTLAAREEARPSQKELEEIRDRLFASVMGNPSTFAIYYDVPYRKDKNLWVEMLREMLPEGYKVQVHSQRGSYTPYEPLTIVIKW